MPFTHREMDQMQLEAQVKIMKMYQEWRMSFEASRILAQVMAMQGNPMGPNARIPTEEEEIIPDREI